MKKIRILIIACLPLIYITQAANDNKNSKNMDQFNKQVSEPDTNHVNNEIKEPYYMIDFSASACYFEMYLNDVPLFNMDVRGQTATEFPVNNLILESGRQVFSVKITPCEGETQFHERSSFSGKILLYDVTEGFKRISEGERYETPNVDENTPLTMSFSIEFDAEVPYKQKAWQNSKDLHKVESLREKVIEHYRYIESLILKKDYTTLENIVAQREKNVSLSMYLDESAGRERIDDLMNEIRKCTLIPITGNEKLIFAGNGKLVTLQKSDGCSVIQLENKKEENIISLAFWLHIPEDGNELEWF